MVTFRTALSFLFLVTVSGVRADDEPAKPTYVIVMIADGTGFNHFEAASLYRTGKEDGLSFQRFPVRLAVSTFPKGGSYDPAKAATNGVEYLRKGATDSAAAATALATGYKTANGWLGMTAESNETENASVSTVAIPRTNIMERAEKKRLSTGVVTSVPFSHATPAGFVAHAAERGDYGEIARQMLASPLEVIIGCGNPDATNEPPPKLGTYMSDPRRFNYVGGAGTWTQMLNGVISGDADGDGTTEQWTFTQDTSALRAMTSSGPAPRRLLGIPHAKNTLQQARPGDAKADPYVEPFTTDMPTLSDLSRAALNVLDDNPRGFVLMIEGGAIDWASHANQSGRMIEEVLDFADAVDSVIAWVDSRKAWDRTLLVITCDHETGGLTGPRTEKRSWWFGPKKTSTAIVSNGKGRLPGVAWNSKGHTNQLVPLFARGMGAEKFGAAATGKDPVRGAYLDNTDIAKAIFELLE